MINCPCSPELLEWVRWSGWEVSSGGDAWVLSDWEIRQYLRSTDGLCTVTEVQRGGRERLLIQAAWFADVERYMTAAFGALIRSRRKLHRINGAGYTPAGVRPPYRLREVAYGRVALVDPDDHERVIMSGGLGTSASHVAAFSWIADASPEDLRASYLDPDGLPLFPGWETIQDPAIQDAVWRLQFGPDRSQWPTW